MDGAATDCDVRRAPRARRQPAGAHGSAHSGHGAAVVGSDAGLLDVALPFLDAGLRAGDLVALTCPPETVELISAIAGRAGRAPSSPSPRMSLLGARAPDALTMCRRYLERAASTGSGRLRGAGRGRLRARPGRLA